MNVVVPYIQSLRKEFTFFLGATILVWVYFAHTCLYSIVELFLYSILYLLGSCLSRSTGGSTGPSYVRATEFEERRRAAGWMELNWYWKLSHFKLRDCCMLNWKCTLGIYQVDGRKWCMLCFELLFRVRQTYYTYYLYMHYLYT